MNVVFLMDLKVKNIKVKKHLNCEINNLLVNPLRLETFFNKECRSISSLELNKSFGKQKITKGQVKIKYFMIFYSGMTLFCATIIGRRINVGKTFFQFRVAISLQPQPITRKNVNVNYSIFDSHFVKLFGYFHMELFMYF